MHREDNSKYMLYIEPKKEDKSIEPIDDHLVGIMIMAINKAEKGASNYSQLNDVGHFFLSFFKGFHSTDCGECSSNCDYLLENGMITNSLAPFYLKWYRNVIPQSEMNKVMELVKFYEQH